MRNEMKVACIYPEEGSSAREIVVESFQLFLRREMELDRKG